MGPYGLDLKRNEENELVVYIFIYVYNIWKGVLGRRIN